MKSQQKTIRICGIVLLVIGILYIIFIILAGIFLNSATSQVLPDENPALVTGVVAATTVIAALFSGGVPAILGIVLMAKSKYQEKAKACFVIGIVVAVLSALSVVSGLSAISWTIIFPIAELVAAILVIKSAHDLKKENEQKI